MNLGSHEFKFYVISTILILIDRRAIEEGCLDGKRVIQIGLRGSGYSTSDYDWAKQQVKQVYFTSLFRKFSSEELTH